MRKKKKNTEENSKPGKYEQSQTGGDKLILNMTFAEAMKKALTTTLPKANSKKVNR